MIPLDRVQAALLLFAGSIASAYVIGLVLAYCRRRPVKVTAALSPARIRPV